LGSLGLLLLAAILHDGWDDVRLELKSARSDIKEIRIDRSQLRFDSVYSKLRVTAEELKYWPQEPECHPWYRKAPPSDLPTFRLSNTADCVASDADLATRDVLWGFGHLGGSTRFATLLLDLSRPSSQRVEVQLEGEAGYRGVGPASPEISIWLPGSFGWDPE
jgi:hypothetical protein